MKRFKISGVPIVDENGKLVGIITNRDLQFERQLQRPIRDVMTAETGLSVPSGDPAALADGIVALLADEARRCEAGLAARRLAQERYGWDGIARRLVEVYERALGRLPVAA